MWDMAIAKRGQLLGGMESSVWRERVVKATSMLLLASLASSVLLL